LELLSTLLPPSDPNSSDTHTSEEAQELEKSPLVIFNPAEEVMYPLRGNLQDLSLKRGVEVDVKGWGDVMEGASRRMSLLVSTKRKPTKY
jgi:pantoate--beta-alanine ligase